MNKQTILHVFILFHLLTSCSASPKKKDVTKNGSTLTFKIKNLSDAEYPKNPDIGFRSVHYQNLFFSEGKIESTSENFKLNVSFFSAKRDSFIFRNMDISELIPTIPAHVKSQPYLSYISCINQEWNRNQIHFNRDEFSSTMPQVVRIDLARNCLSAYLWEVIVYIDENGKTLPYAHGWFDFPHELYAQLFEQKNNIPFAVYKNSLENWVDLNSEKVNLDKLRIIIDTVSIQSNDRSDEMYPLTGARKKKYKEIISPKTFTTMRDLQSDSTTFATFSPPGFYNKKDPRKTELGRLYYLINIELNKIKTTPKIDTLYELVLHFKHRITDQKTQLVIGGIDLDNFPVLGEEKANNGWKSSMGIGNHTFYESYQAHLKNKSSQSSYYAMFLDENGKWLDSHKIGIDGPIFHFSDPERKTLHLWLLSFERHALVGHYEITMN